MLNRCAITVRAKQAFLDWLLQLPDPVDAEQSLKAINREPHVYLLQNYAYIAKQDELIAHCYDLILESELGGWWLKPSDWPTNRMLTEFKKWFEVQFHSRIEDLVDGPLIDG